MSTIDPLNKEAGPGVYSVSYNPTAFASPDIDILLQTIFWGAIWETAKAHTPMRTAFNDMGWFPPEDPEQLVKTGHISVIGQGPWAPTRGINGQLPQKTVFVENPPDITDPDFFVGPVQTEGRPFVNDLAELKGVKPPGQGPPTQIGGGGGEGSVRPDDGLIYPRKV